MLRRLFRISVTLVIWSVLASGAASADPVVLYSNFGSAPGYSIGTAADPQGYVLQYESQTYMMGFQPSQTGQLSSIRVPLVWSSPVSTDFNAVVFGPGGFSDPIETINFNGPPDGQPGQASLLQATSVLNPTLAADTQYFLGLFIRERGTIWPWNNSDATGPYVRLTPVNSSLQHGILGAFEVAGELAPVPEPSTLLLFTTSAGILLQRIRRRGFVQAIQ
jgi:hypothetical protein